MHKSNIAHLICSSQEIIYTVIFLPFPFSYKCVRAVVEGNQCLKATTLLKEFPYTWLYMPLFN